MGKATGVGASLLKDLHCAIDVNPKSAKQIAYEVEIAFESDVMLKADLKCATTLDEIIEILTRAYYTYLACPKRKHQKRAMRIKIFMHKHNLRLRQLAAC